LAELRTWGWPRLALLTIVVGAGGLVAWCASHVVRTPALVKDPAAITGAIGDALSNSLAREVMGTDLFAAGRRRSNSPFIEDRPLCSAAALSDPTSGIDCRFWAREPASACVNLYGCATLRVHPTILRDPALNRALRSALATPCAKLPPKTNDPAEPVLNSLTHPLYLDRLILRCDQDRPLKLRVLNIETETGHIRLRF
jgi:hypothetical protein